ncbi:MAG: CopG family transcriptional regulator [Acidimicrobiales bacterium]
MRTTLRLDDDVLIAVKERARRENRSAGEVLSDLARVALTRPPGSDTNPSDDTFFGFHPLPSRGQLVSNALIDELREDSPEG